MWNGAMNPMEEANIWFAEAHDEGVALTFKITNHLFSKKSAHQRIDIFETLSYGKMLVLDGRVQLTEKDEFIYHEMLVHIPMLHHPAPRRVLIIGGGDGGAAKEAVKHDVESVTVVEIDEDVVRAAKEYLPFTASAYDDPRVHLHIGDGVQFIEQSDEKYDVVLVDSTDPIGPAEMLFAGEFYGKLKRVLNPGAVVAIQAGSPWYSGDVTAKSYRLLRESFRDVRIYLAPIPTYPAGMWSFIMASDAEMGEPRPITFSTRYITDDVMRGAFALPRFLLEALEG